MSEFVHLHVASGFSMRYGAATPATLVQRAAAWGQPALALTDRDGLYGAVRFVQACVDHQVAPILGVDLAVVPPGAQPTDPAGRAGPAIDPAGSTRRTPAGGGQFVDPRHPRVTVLARGQLTGIPPGAGWARLCRLVTDTHLAGERGLPVADPRVLARHTVPPAAPGPSPLVVLLGPDSDVGRALLARREAAALAALDRWRALLPPDALAIETVCHGGPDDAPASLSHAARLLALARHTGLRAVLTAMVRHADPGGAAICDVLDATRRLVPLDVRHLDRTTTAGHLASTPAMHALAHDIARAMAGGTGGDATRLIEDTAALAMECVQDPGADIGIGAVHLPEPQVLGIAPGGSPQHVLARRCREAIPTRYAGATDTTLAQASDRLEDELAVIATLGYASYFLTVAVVCDLIRDMGVRVAARGSGAGSIVNYLLGISGVEPLAYGLVMERFCTTLRAQLPDIDIDVESARRTEIYQRVIDRFGGERVTCVSMMDTYRVRHAIRDVGAALGLPPGEIDAMAKAFPRISARRVRQALAELPELAASGLTAPRYRLMLDLVEGLDELPRHIAVHPCGVVLSNAGLLDRTPVEASWLGFPMSQFDKDDVEALGLLKLDILGIRMQSAMAHAVAEVERVEGLRLDLEDRAQVPLDDEATFRLIRTSHTLGCFQIESPGQRELIGKFGPESFEDLIVDISLFRPGPVKTEMIRPFLDARHGFARPDFLHPSLRPALAETEGIVVFHEQILQIVAITAGVSLAVADEARRALGSPEGQQEVERWWRPAAAARGYTGADCDRIWEVLVGFASFGFCKAHAAAFALPTYQSAWLKTHHPAAFFAGVLTHDPGMYPKRLILDDARNLGIAILGLDVNASRADYRIERLDPADLPPPVSRDPDLPAAGGFGLRLALADVQGMSAAEIERIVAGQPYASLADFWRRAQVSRPIAERLALAGAFDSLYAIAGAGLGRRGRMTRRDIVVHIADLEAWSRPPGVRRRAAGRSLGSSSRGAGVMASSRGGGMTETARGVGVAALASAQSQAARATIPAADQPVQLTLDLGDAPARCDGLGLPELTGPERVRAELEILGLDASGHVVEFYAPMLDALGVTWSRDLLDRRHQAQVWVAGVKAATQTPPIRSGRRVIFLTLDDSTGPVDCTFFEDVQGACASTVFHSWLLLVRGMTRRTGRRGISVRATGAWELPALWEAWRQGGLPRVQDAIAHAEQEAEQRARQWSSDPQRVAPETDTPGRWSPDTAGATPQRRGNAAGGMGGGTGPGRSQRRVLVHASGFVQSPYADVVPAGTSGPPRKLWHSSPGSSGG